VTQDRRKDNVYSVQHETQTAGMNMDVRKTKLDDEQPGAFIPTYT